MRIQIADLFSCLNRTENNTFPKLYVHKISNVENSYLCLWFVFQVRSIINFINKAKPSFIKSRDAENKTNIKVENMIKYTFKLV